MRPFTDVPVQRPSVGAMALAAGSQMPAKIDKPYVYKGTGEDVFPETRDWGGNPKPKPTKAQIMERARKKRIARQRTAERRKADREWRRKRREAEREAHRARMAAKRAAGWKPGDEGRVTLAKRRAQQAAERQALRDTRGIRPSPGWKPLTGGDLLDLLGEDDP